MKCFTAWYYFDVFRSDEAKKEKKWIDLWDKRVNRIFEECSAHISSAHGTSICFVLIFAQIMSKRKLWQTHKFCDFLWLNQRFWFGFEEIIGFCLALNALESFHGTISCQKFGSCDNAWRIIFGVNDDELCNKHGGIWIWHFFGLSLKNLTFLSQRFSTSTFERISR